jgi:hypothetical protein
MRAYDPHRRARTRRPRSVCMRKLDRLDWAMEGTYRLGDATVGIRTTSERFGRWVDDVLQDHRRARWRDAFYSVVVAEEERAGRRGFHMLYKGTLAVARTAHLGTLARAFLEEMESNAFRGRSDAIYLDASLVGGPQGTALVPSSFAPALSGQSRRAERLGVTLPATTWVAIDPETAEAVPVTSAIGIPPDAAEWLVGPRGVVRPDRLFVDRPIRVDAVCLIHDDPSGDLVPISRSTVLYRFAAMSQNLPRIGGGRTLEALGRLVSSATCFAITPSTAPRVLEAMAEITRGAFGRVRALT